MENEILLRIIVALCSSNGALDMTEHATVKKARKIYDFYNKEALDIAGTAFATGTNEFRNS